MKLLDLEIDEVINGIVAIGYTDYKYAFNTLIPLIDKTDFQRKRQDKKFYKKLERDLDAGCVMPPITIAFINPDIKSDSNLNEITAFVSKNIKKSFVLDGIQRLNTLSRLVDSKKINKDRKLYINFLFCDSVEKLLYRMITLNNGQRPMTPRHQVEMMMANAFDFNEFGLEIQTEKEAANKIIRKAFRKSDIIQAYLAFMAESPIIDNKKIIEEKMDELLVNKIMSIEPNTYKSKFEDVIKSLSKFQENPKCLKWLKLTNNLVGFAVGMKSSSKTILSLSVSEFKNAITTFDSAFSEFNPSRIKVGKFRRELSCEYFKNFNEYKDLDSDELLEYFSELTNE
ncbi:hypothetical protein KKI24_24300 [bacterium]|nr:hypothetical protein [bacterium]